MVYTKKKTKKRKNITLKNRKKPIVFGYVYSATCGYCISMKNEWNKLKKDKDVIKLKNNDIGDNYPFKINTFNKKYRTDLKVEGVPTIFKLDKKGNNIEYYPSMLPKRKGLIKKWLFR